MLSENIEVRLIFGYGKGIEMQMPKTERRNKRLTNMKRRRRRDLSAPANPAELRKYWSSAPNNKQGSSVLGDDRRVKIMLKIS